MFSKLPYIATEIGDVYRAIADEYTSSELNNQYLAWWNWCGKLIDQATVTKLLIEDDTGVVSATSDNYRVCVKFTITPLSAHERDDRRYRFYAIESVWHYHTEDARRHLTLLATETVVDHRFPQHRTP